MAAFVPTGLQTTPPSDLRGAGSSPRESGIGMAAAGLALSALLLFAGWILLKSASELPLGDPPPSAWPEAGTAPQVWQTSAVRAAKLPREWTWERPAIRFDAMFRIPR